MCIQVEPYYAQQYVDTLQANANDMTGLQLLKALKPNFSKQGDQYRFLFGQLPDDCIVGVGNTPYAAMIDFQQNFYNYKAKQ